MPGIDWNAKSSVEGLTLVEHALELKEQGMKYGEIAKAVGAPSASSARAAISRELAARSSSLSQNVIAKYLDNDGGLTLLVSLAEKDEFKAIGKIPSDATVLNKTEYRALAKACMTIIETDGLAGAFVDMMIELNSGGFENRVSDEKKADKLKPVIDMFCAQVNTGDISKTAGADEIRKKFVRNWWGPGLLVWLDRSGPVTVTGAGSKKHTMPVDIELLNPMQVDLDDLKTKGIVKYEFGTKFSQIIKDWEKNKLDLNLHPVISLWPEKVDKNVEPFAIDRTQAIADIKSNKPVPLPKGQFTMIRRVFDDWTLYPVPFLVRYFPTLEDKNVLRAMDRSLMRKVINIILAIKVKPQDELTKITKADLDKAVKSLETSLTENSSRMQVAGLPHTVELQYITVPADSMYKKEHYQAINYAGLEALFGPVAGQFLSDSGNADQSVLHKALYGKNEVCLQAWKRWWEGEIYDAKIIVPNKVQIERGKVNVVVKRITIHETDAYKTFIRDGVRGGWLPAKVAIDHAGEDEGSCFQQLEKEAKLRVEKGILIGFPSYTQTVYKPGAKDEKDAGKQQVDDETTTKTPEGRPNGTDGTEKDD